MDLVEWLESEKNDTLTTRDALLTVALCAAEIDADPSQGNIDRIAYLAQSHPMFVEEFEAVKERINTLTGFMHNTDPEEAIGLAAKTLTPELRETAFKWAVNMALNNGFLSEEKKSFLGKLVIQFMIDMEIAEKLYAEVAEKIYQ